MCSLIFSKIFTLLAHKIRNKILFHNFRQKWNIVWNKTSFEIKREDTYILIFYIKEHSHMIQHFFCNERASKAIQKHAYFLCSLIITHNISFARQIQPRVSIKNPSCYEQTLSERQSEINEKFSGLISRKMMKTPCPQRAPNQSTFLWFHMGGGGS